MKPNFKSKMDICGSVNEFIFEQVFYGNEPYYHITVILNKKSVTFRMARDESGQWKIQAQILPECIHQAELKFNDEIENSDEIE